MKTKSVPDLSAALKSAAMAASSTSRAFQHLSRVIAANQKTDAKTRRIATQLLAGSDKLEALNADFRLFVQSLPTSRDPRSKDLEGGSKGV